MKTSFVKLMGTGIVICAALLTASCGNEEEFSKDTPKPAPSQSARFAAEAKFDQAKFALLVEKYLEPRVAGFGYALYNDGVEYYRTNGGDGWARKPFDLPYQQHGAIVRQETMEVTQYITAVAVIKALEKYNVPIKEKVYKFLPAHWSPSTKFKELSFERLLAHKTGLINYKTGVLSLRKTVEGPVQETEFSQLVRDDDHVNYDLLAVALPYVQARGLALEGKATMLNQLNSYQSDWALLQTTAMYFREFTRNNVFIPAGITNIPTKAWQAWDSNGELDADKSTKGYPSKIGNEPGIAKTSNINNPGAKGLYISAAQFAKIQAAVSHFKIISLTGTEAMKNGLLGYDGKLSRAKGTYYYKKGEGDNCKTIIFNFGKVQFAVFTNSLQSEITDPEVVAEFYDQSWISM